MSESDGVSDDVRSRKTRLFRLSEGLRGAFDASQFVLDLVVWFLFSKLPQQMFCKGSSLFLLLFQKEYLTVGSGLAKGRYLMLREPQQKLTAKNKNK